MLPQQVHAAEIRARLRNPANAKIDPGINLRATKPKVVPYKDFVLESERRRVEAEKQRRFDAACLSFFNWQWESAVRREKELLQRRPSRTDPTLNEIIRTVARYCEVPIPSIKSIRKTAKEVYARHLIFWLARELTCRSLPEIGRMIGGRDHTTILHGARKIEQMKARDPVIRDDLKKLLSALRPHDPENDNAEDPARTGG